MKIALRSKTLVKLGGKSTLANVLSGIVDSEEHSISENENFQKKDFEWRGTKYRVVDTIGKEVTYEKMGELIHLIPEGLNQVLIDGIAEYITIVRTKFSNFKNESDLCRQSPDKLIFVDDEDDEETIRINRKRRDQSRNILLEHLEKTCHKLEKWDNLCAKIDSYIPV
ncbi:kinase-like domain-containing protein [Rhizophagus irregularis DAOM 181602=DAOM 197198]|nr:kinase-like domain-containing protein [Rhizophagus irregularis DAOM 181602=DAOM 197198]